jgi:hypothetical protein
VFEREAIEGGCVAAADCGICLAPSRSDRKTSCIEGIVLGMALELGKGFLSESLLFDLQ